MGNPFQLPCSMSSRTAGGRRVGNIKHRKKRNQEEEEERVEMLIRELQKLIPNSTIHDVDSVLDEAIKYLKFLQSKHRAIVEAIGSWRTALAAATAGLQCPQQPMGSTLNHGISFHYGRPAMSFYSGVPLFSASSLPTAHSPPRSQATAALPGHLAQLPYPPLNVLYVVPAMPSQFSPVAGNLPTWPHHMQSSAPGNQEENRSKSAKGVL